MITGNQQQQQANALMAKQRWREARRFYEQLCRENPKNLENLCTLAGLCSQLGDASAAETWLRQALSIDSGYAPAHYLLGNVYYFLHEVEQALECYKRALALQPRYTLVHLTLGRVFRELGSLDQAAAAYENVTRLSPGMWEGHLGLGGAYNDLGRKFEAETCCRKALALSPDQAEAWFGLGDALGGQARLDEAVAAYERARKIKPTLHQAHSCELATLNYLVGQDPAQLFQAHRAWDTTHAPANPQAVTFRNVPDPIRRLRIAYVSRDLRNHAVSFFISPLLKFHDSTAVEVFCYSDALRSDAVTEQLKTLGGQWRDTSRLNRDRFCELVRADAIDILVDLAGHTRNNRLPAFTRRLAPVQVSYLGYPNTTGLQSMDYRLTDDWADPAGQEVFYTEQLVRLAGCFVCYGPPTDSPPVAPLPARQTNHITFGSFNNVGKINQEVAAVWSEILQAVPGSKLLIKHVSLSDPRVRERLYKIFEACHMSRERVEVHEPIPSQRAHLETYGRVDLALDTFPYNGTTTTCEALWMGVPVITLAGAVHRERVGVSLLRAVGMEQCIATTREEYIKLAVEMAANLDELGRRRGVFRDQMLASSLCDGRAFARKVEVAYRQMWSNWCRSHRS